MLLEVDLVAKPGSGVRPHLLFFIGLKRTGRQAERALARELLGAALAAAGPDSVEPLRRSRPSLPRTKSRLGGGGSRQEMRRTPRLSFCSAESAAWRTTEAPGVGVGCPAVRRDARRDGRQRHRPRPQSPGGPGAGRDGRRARSPAPASLRPRPSAATRCARAHPPTKRRQAAQRPRWRSSRTASSSVSDAVQPERDPERDRSQRTDLMFGWTSVRRTS